jgi:hypothetical protein
VAALIRGAGATRPELQQRLAAGVLLVGEGGEVAGLGRLLERRVRQQLAAIPETSVSRPARCCAGLCITTYPFLC